MMMSAMRRSRKSSKSKRRSRKLSHDEESEEKISTQRSASEGRQAKRQTVIPNHGDIADSGIDSGNGVTEPDALVTTPSRISSGEPTEREPRPRSSLDKEHQKDRPKSVLDNHVSERSASHGQNAPQPTEHNNSEHSSGSSASKKRSSKSKHRKDRPSAAGNEADQSLAPANESKEMSGSNEPPTPDSPGLTEKPSASGAAETPDTRSERPSEETTPPSAPEAKQCQSTAVKVPGERSRADSEDTAASSRVRERRRKLEERLEQAKKSLTSPHVVAAVDSYELSEAALEGPPNTSLLHEFRRLFQQELTRLRMELDAFRSFCCKLMEEEAAMLCGKLQEGAGSDKREPSTQARQTQAQKQMGDAVMDEEELQRLEDDLAARVKDLQEYEKEILEVESMLNQRQAICERRQAALLALDEELHCLREDIFEKKESLRSETDTSSERARKNWDFVRRHMTDKQALLEATIQRHRTTIASANASLAAKDSLIAHLQKQLKEAQDKSKSMEKKVERLENKLVFASEEMHALLHTRHNSALPPAPSPAPGQSASLRRQSRSVRGSSTSSASGSLLLRQNSESAATATATAFNALQRQKSESGPAALNSLQRQKSESGPTALNALPRQRSVSPERGAGGHSRAVSAPGAGRRMSSHHPDLPPSLAREQSLKRRNYRRSQSVSVSNSAVNSATNASAACAIL